MSFLSPSYLFGNICPYIFKAIQVAKHWLYARNGKWKHFLWVLETNASNWGPKDDEGQKRHTVYTRGHNVSQIKETCDTSSCQEWKEGYAEEWHLVAQGIPASTHYMSMYWLSYT